VNDSYYAEVLLELAKNPEVVFLFAELEKLFEILLKPCNWALLTKETGKIEHMVLKNSSKENSLFVKMLLEKGELIDDPDQQMRIRLTVAIIITTLLMALVAPAVRVSAKESAQQYTVLRVIMDNAAVRQENHNKGKVITKAAFGSLLYGVEKKASSKQTLWWKLADGNYIFDGNVEDTASCANPNNSLIISACNFPSITARDIMLSLHVASLFAVLSLI